MPRISPKLVKQALRDSRLLPPLLRANPNLEQAKLELKWIKNELPKSQWHDAIRRRSKLEPLQYILGSQPFGALDILCRRNVLIPRWETEEWVMRISALVRKYHSQADGQLKILDVCTGSGCIPLLLNYELSEVQNIPLKVHGCDISKEAVDLSMTNLKKYEEIYPLSSQNIEFSKGDIFDESILQNILLDKKLSLVTSNPPYIPIHDFNSPVLINGIEKSVRQYEPSIALVGENEFYEALVKNVILKLNPEGFVFEVGYIEQVEFVANMLAQKSYWLCGMMKDSSGNVRCVVGWMKGSKMQSLQEVCEVIY